MCEPSMVLNESSGQTVELGLEASESTGQRLTSRFVGEFSMFPMVKDTEIMWHEQTFLSIL